MSDLLDRVGTKDIARNKQTLSGKEKGVLSLRYVALIFLVFFAIAPIYIMVVNSFKGISGVSQSAAWSIPTHLNFAAWGPVWDNLKGSMGRTLFFVVQSSIISAIIGSINGYVFAKWKFRGSTVIFTTFLFGMFTNLPVGYDQWSTMDWSSISFNQWLGIGFVVVFATYLGYLLLVFGLRDRKSHV